MPLSTVIIADDDYLVIEDLKKSIQWKELGYVVAGTATNGLDALRLVKQHHPDLLITDIIMPSMTGLELIEQARRLDPDMQILIISSYDEFEYAKSAITHGVADYLLKTQITPMSFSQRLIELSNSAISKKRRNQAALRQSLRDYFNHRTAEPLTERADPVLYAVSMYKYYFIVIGVHTPFVTNKERFDRIVYENTVRAEDTISAKFVDSSIPIRFGFGPFLILGFVSPRDAQQGYQGLQGIVAKLRSILDTTIGRSVSIFTGVEPCTLPEFRERYFRLLPLMEFNAAFCANSTKTFRELERQTCVCTEQPFPFASIRWRAKELSEDLDRFTDCLQQCIACKDVAALHSAYWLLCSYLRSNGGGRMPEDADCCYFHNPQMLISHVRRLVLAQGDSGVEDSGKAVPRVVDSAMQYIQLHFGDHEISVQSISEAVNVSSGRLGVLFRQCLGKSINEYLTDARIEHAIYLLENTSMKIYEVADRCGFNTPHYFSDIMYKKTGKRPIDYKRLPTRE
ncbi:MAG: response regulator [Eubacteriales bacterium]|nr:response regulator [Eubacteriales bacterium]